MSGRLEAGRDLLLGLHALESGAIDRDQFVAGVRAWTQAGDRTLSEILAGLGRLDAITLARFEDQVAEELATTAPEGGTATDPLATIAHVSSAPPRIAPDRNAEGGRFQILKPHARGGLGEVFLAFDRELNRPVALKELQEGRAHDLGSQARFLFEAEVTGKLEHPGIVPVYSLGRYEDGRPYYAMRLIEGETLRQAIERFHRAGASTLAEGEREVVFRRLLGSVIDTCNAVAYAHSRGVVHRDLKPDNIMLGRFGETLVVDWGVAKSLDSPLVEGDHSVGDDPSGSASMTRPGAVMGTPRYMSPEQAAGDLDRIGPASDIYGLGAILYCLLVGQAPFPDGDMESVLDRVRRGIFPAPRRLRRTVDPTLEATCMKAMSLDPRDRHASALELAGELEAWQAAVRYRGEHEEAVGQVKASLTRLCLERAHQGFGRDSHAEGMLWLSRALENAPEDLQRMVRMSLWGWHVGAKSLERNVRHTSEVHAIAFSPDGRKLATACDDGTARLWDVSAATPLSQPWKHGGPVRALAFRSDGAVIVTGCDDGTIRRWDAITGEPFGGDPIQHNGPIHTLALNPDGSRLAASGPGGVSLWDAGTGEALLRSAGPSPGLALAFTPDGSALAIASDEEGVQLLDAASGRPLRDPLKHASAVRAIAFDPIGRALLTGCADGETRLWDVTADGPAVTISHQGSVHGVGFRPGGGAFATACDDGTARLWDSVTGRPIGEPLSHRGRIHRLAFRPDGTILATGGADGMVRLWCADTGLPIGPPLAKEGTVRALAFSPDGRRLAAGGSKSPVHCWKAPDPIEGPVERLSCWVRVTTELEFDEGDAIRRMDGPTRWELLRRLTDLGGPPIR